MGHRDPVALDAIVRLKQPPRTPLLHRVTTLAGRCLRHHREQRCGKAMQALDEGWHSRQQRPEFAGADSKGLTRDLNERVLSRRLDAVKERHARHPFETHNRRLERRPVGHRIHDRDERAFGKHRVRDRSSRIVDRLSVLQGDWFEMRYQLLHLGGRQGAEQSVTNVPWRVESGPVRV